MINGVINIYKEKGYTSHDVVAKLRGIFHQKKIGHTGTLDPDAEGVLLVCLGKATKICDMLTDRDKTYETVMLLGVDTDTQDISGNVKKTGEPETDVRKIMDAIDSFVGEYDQIPPMYSALKVNGRKLYELARDGIEVERKPRRIVIKSIRVNEINSDEHTVRMTVECSKGTYIRTLCHDIGESLGCGACMKELKRIAVGDFLVSSAVTLGSVQAKVLLGNAGDDIIPVDSIFSQMRAAHTSESADAAVHNGNSVMLDEKLVQIEGEPVAESGESFRMYDSAGNFIGIYACDEAVLKNVKMFYDSEEAIKQGVDG